MAGGPVTRAGRGGLLPGEPAAQARARQKNRQKVFCRSGAARARC